MAHAMQDQTSLPASSNLKAKPRPVFTSKKSKVSASSSADVNVALKLDAKDVDLKDALSKLQSLLKDQASAPLKTNTLMEMTRSVMKEVIEAGLKRQLGDEFNEIVAAYRDMLERRMASGQDEALSRALTRAKLQTETLSSVPMVEQGQACTLLGLSDANPSATMKRYEAKDRILRFDWKGKAAYPFFQFDVAERRIYPALLKIMKMRTDDWGGKMALLHWLTRPNRSLGGGRPCDRLTEDADALVVAFEAEISAPLHG
jgi:hypothetical protein